MKMHFEQHILRAAAGLIVLAGLTAPASAGGKLRAEELARPVVYAEGCYWHRGERYCSRYCYIEVNGRRYCHKRRREAVPQADGEELPPERRYRGTWTR
jgi:hypothetical protein